MSLRPLGNAEKSVRTHVQVFVTRRTVGPASNGAAMPATLSERPSTPASHCYRRQHLRAPPLGEKGSSQGSCLCVQLWSLCNNLSSPAAYPLHISLCAFASQDMLPYRTIGTGRRILLGFVIVLTKVLPSSGDHVVGGPQLMTEYREVHRLSFDGDVRGLKALIDTHGTSVIDEVSENGWSALLIAARQGHAPIVQLLLSINADVMKHKTARGESALSLACSWNRTAVVDVLMRWGADPTGLPQAGTSHLTTAIELNGDRMPGPVTILLEHGVFDVDETTEVGLIALFVACRMGAVGVVRTLLKAGADPELRVKGGITPAEAAAAMCVTGGVHQIFKNHEQCLQLLEDWKVIYPLIRARSIRDTVLLVSTHQRHYTAHIPLYLKGRLAVGTPLPMVEAGGKERERRKGKCGARGKPRGHRAPVTAVQIKHKRMREAVVQQHVVQYALVCLPPDVFRELRELLM